MQLHNAFLPPVVYNNSDRCEFYVSVIDIRIMTNTSLITALVFASVFGAIIVWLVLFFTHQYIHLRYQELTHWVQRITADHSTPECCHHEGKRRSRSRSRRRGKSRDDSGRPRKQYRGRDVESYGLEDIDGRQHLETAMARPKQLLPMEAPQANGQQCFPSVGWQDRAPPISPVTYPQPVKYPAFNSRRAAAIPRPMSHQRAPQLPLPKPHPEASVPKHRNTPQQLQSQPRRTRQADRVDYIHICDEYPPIVLEAMRKSAPKRPFSVSSSSSGSSDSTQEVPRASIPHARVHFSGQGS